MYNDSNAVINSSSEYVVGGDFVVGGGGVIFFLFFSFVWNKMTTFDTMVFLVINFVKCFVNFCNRPILSIQSNDR